MKEVLFNPALVRRWGWASPFGTNPITLDGHIPRAVVSDILWSTGSLRCAERLIRSYWVRRRHIVCLHNHWTTVSYRRPWFWRLRGLC